jgi:cellulose synthase/poly-beta-1,6-N-acetylglucosamine synthase-like glycosyltransferase
LRSVFKQDFDRHLLEIILVNDGSTDNTQTIVENVFSQYTGACKIINNKGNLGKKKSITAAIKTCNSELIICRDADTYTESDQWLKTIVSFYEEKGNEFIIAPLEIENKNGFLAQLQHYENSALVIITGGYAFYKKAFLCNGANLAFTKRIFEKVGGYKNHLNLNSGDDVLLLEDVKKTDPETVAYLKNPKAAVITYPLKSIKKLLEQKVRWASKFDKNPNQINAFLGIIVCLVHVFSLFYLIKPIIAHHIPLFGIIFICLRVLIDFLLLFLASRYYNRPLKWLWFLPLSFFYSFYVILTAIFSLVIKPNRK